MLYNNKMNKVPIYVADFYQSVTSGQDMKHSLRSILPYRDSDQKLRSVLENLGYRTNSEETLIERPREAVIEALEDIYGLPEKPTVLNNSIPMNINSLDIAPKKEKSDKNLKSLSLKIKNIISNNEPMSYKEISNALLQEFAMNFRLKESRNMLRRAYDALNVLIALGMIKKRNKLYYWIGDYANLHSRSERNKFCRERLRDMWGKLHTLQRLIKRNKTACSNTEVLKFPLIVISTEDSSSNFITMETNRDKNDLKLKFKKPTFMIEDTDIAKELTLPETEIDPSLRHLLDVESNL